jgi:predicted nucleic acid-binding protein
MVSPPVQYLLDTNILLHLVRQDALARWIEDTYGFVRQAANPLVSVVTEGEIRSLGLQFGWGAVRLARLETLLARAVIVPLEFEGVIEAYARIEHHARRAGRPIGENDAWLAATAHATTACLLTTDRDLDELTPTFLNRDWIDPTLHR